MSSYTCSVLSDHRSMKINVNYHIWLRKNIIVVVKIYYPRLHIIVLLEIYKIVIDNVAVYLSFHVCIQQFRDFSILIGILM